MKYGFLNTNLGDSLIALEEVNVPHSGELIRMDAYLSKNAFADTAAVARCVKELNELPEIREIGYFIEGKCGQGPEELNKIHFVTDRSTLDLEKLSAAFHKAGLLREPDRTWREIVSPTGISQSQVR